MNGRVKEVNRTSMFLGKINYSVLCNNIASAFLQRPLRK